MNSIKQNERESVVSDCERLPFPAVLVDPTFELLERNRLAQKLLPAPWRLRRFLKRFESEEKKERFFVSNLEDRYYFVAILSHPKGFQIAFLENLTYLYEPLLQTVLGEGVEIMEQWEARELLFLQGFRQEDRGLAERIVARTCRAREQMTMVHRLLSCSGRTLSGAVPCNVSGLVRLLQSKLKEYRIQLDFESEQGAICLVSPEALVAVVVNLIQFVLIYEGQSALSLSLSERQDQWALQISFEEREGLFSSFAALFQARDSEEKLPRNLGLAPLFSSIILCRENGLKMELVSEDGNGRIELFLPDAKEREVQFLGSGLGKEEKMVEAWIRRILFPNR